MNKILVVFMLVGSLAFAQGQERTINKKGELFEVTYYHDNGIVAQHGFIDELNSLQGTWTSFDVKGNKTAIGTYNNGEKVGKWLFWFEDKLTEIDYKNYKMVAINEWSGKSSRVIND